jgi:hypothetical protein
MFHMWNKNSFLVTIDLWYASKLLGKNDYLAKSRYLLEMVGLYQLKSCFKQKELQNVFFVYVATPFQSGGMSFTSHSLDCVSHLPFKCACTTLSYWWIWHCFIVYIFLIAHTWIQTTLIHSLDGVYMEIVGLLLCCQ